MLKVIANGSKWAGDTEDPIEVLFERLLKHVLDPRWEECFIHRAYGAIEGGRDASGRMTFVDTGPIYPDAPGALRFCGNFLEVSAVFTIDTDEPETIERLTSLIRQNQARPEYQQARQSLERALGHEPPRRDRHREAA